MLVAFPSIQVLDEPEDDQMETIRTLQVGDQVKWNEEVLEEHKDLDQKGTYGEGPFTIIDIHRYSEDFCPMCSRPKPAVRHMVPNTDQWCEWDGDLSKDTAHMVIRIDCDMNGAYPWFGYNWFLPV